jgi:glutamine synthetase
VILKAIGSHTAEWFIEAKRHEWNQYRIQVTPWEIAQYLETY